MSGWWRGSDGRCDSGQLWPHAFFVAGFLRLSSTEIDSSETGG